MVSPWKKFAFSQCSKKVVFILGSSELAYILLKYHRIWLFRCLHLCILKDHTAGYRSSSPMPSSNAWLWTRFCLKKTVVEIFSFCCNEFLLRPPASISWGRGNCCSAGEGATSLPCGLNRFVSSRFGNDTLVLGCIPFWPIFTLFESLFWFSNSLTKLCRHTVKIMAFSLRIWIHFR